MRFLIFAYFSEVWQWQQSLQNAGSTAAPEADAETSGWYASSIVAQDPATGQLGVAVQSHWFSVGPIVAWAEAGVGAVATQSFVEIKFAGKNGLDMMRSGSLGQPFS